MKWGSSKPTKEGWYLVTLNNNIVMPMYRKEYPPKNFTWDGSFSFGVSVLASIKFPKPYVGICIE